MKHSPIFQSFYTNLRQGASKAAARLTIRSKIFSEAAKINQRIISFSLIISLLAPIIFFGHTPQVAASVNSVPVSQKPAVNFAAPEPFIFPSAHNFSIFTNLASSFLNFLGAGDSSSKTEAAKKDESSGLPVKTTNRLLMFVRQVIHR